MDPFAMWVLQEAGQMARFPLRPSSRGPNAMTSSSRAAESGKAGPRIRPVPAVSRAVAILRLLGSAKEPMNAKSIARQLDLVPSTCLHILRALTSERLLSFDAASKRYRLGAGMLALARGVQETNSFAHVVQPMLDAIAERWGVTAMGVEVVDLQHIIVTALSRSRTPFRLHVDIGSRFPSLISATGRLVAAFGPYPEVDIRTQFDKLRWTRPLRFDDWMQEVQAARQAGVSADEGNYIAGISLVAVPILDACRRITHTIVAAGIVQQLSPDDRQALIQELQRCAQQVSWQLYSLE